MSEDRPTLRAVEEPSPRRRRLRTAAVLVAALAVIGGVIYGLLQTSAFAVGSVKVTGQAHLSEADIVALAAVPIGTPMVSVDESHVAKRVESSPWVSSVAVGQSWPDTLTISVVERQAVAAVQADDGRWTQVAEGGVVLEVGAQLTAGLPVLINERVAPTPGALVSEKAQKMVTLVTQLPDSLRPKVVQVERSDQGETRLGLSTGPIVELGNDDGLGDKLMAAASVIASEDNEDINVLDVRTPRLPINIPATTTTTTAVAPQPGTSSTTSSTTVS